MKRLSQDEYNAVLFRIIKKQDPKGYKRQVQNTNFTTIFLIVEIIVFVGLIWYLTK